MSNEILTVSLEVLGDGQVKAITSKGNQEVFLQPVIFVDSKEPNLRLEIKGSRGNQIRVSTDISSIDGTAFSGTFEELETALREMALKANGLRVGGVSNSSGGSVALDKTISLSYTGNSEYNLTSDSDIDGKLIPAGSFGDISSIQDLDAGNVNYRFDGGTPSADYPTINGNRAFDKLTNVEFDTFQIKAGAGGAAYTLIINLYK